MCFIGLLSVVAGGSMLMSTAFAPLPLYQSKKYIFWGGYNAARGLISRDIFTCKRNYFYQIKKNIRAWQDSNLQSPDPKSGALSIRPHTHYKLFKNICILNIFISLQQKLKFNFREKNHRTSKR